MDKIKIRDLSLRCIIGLNAEERREKQDVVINVVLYADLSQAGKSDDFKDTIDYKAVKLKILDLVENSSFYLVEALAENIADLCLEFIGVEQVEVSVEKPGALRFAKSVGVEISRNK
jgi:D-erythro-7,8-dihydroneopterin triphosphate epimerase